MGKAGSTAIQSFLNDNRGILAKNGFVYPNMWHHLLAHKWGGGWIPQYILDRANITERWKALQQAVAGDARQRAFILSSERLAAAALEFNDVASYIAGLFGEIPTKIVLYLRPQEDLAESEYKQRVHGGLRISFDEYVSNLPPYFDFEALLVPWTAAFGAENIIVRRYTRDNLVADFLEAVGIPATLPFNVSEKRMNLSLSALSTQLIVGLRLKNNRIDRQRIEIIRSLCDGDPRRLTSDTLREELRQRYAQSNRHVASAFFDEPELFPSRETAPAPVQRARA
ncbi:MAG TPA: hypothetical protein VHC71_04535 [Hyphomicrobium sp.]|nr:hypothetical protein [Hyphomicrobium sp.]